MLLCCLVATQAEAIKARMVWPDEAKIWLAKDANDILPYYLNHNHEHLRPIVEIYNQTLAITRIPSKAIYTWKTIQRDSSFRSMSNSKKRMQRYGSFKRKLIQKSDNITKKYPYFSTQEILEKLHNDTQNLIDNVKDFKAHKYLTAELGQAFQGAIAEQDEVIRRL